MRKTVAFILALFLALPSISQKKAPLPGEKKLPPLGEVTLEELKMKHCSFDPDAPAMKLFETEEVNYELYSYGDMKLETEHRTRIKIFNEKGYKHATVTIPYLTKKSLGKVKELTAYVYSLDANDKIVVQKLSKDDFFKQTVIGKLGMIRFSFPNLKPGSVVEYSYTRLEQNFYDIDPWRIQDDIPTAYSSMVLITPLTSLLHHKLYGEDSLRELPLRKKNSQLQYRSWYMENVPAFKAEPLMTSWTDNRTRMVFFHFPVNNSLIKTITNPVFIWSMVGERMLESADFGGRIKRQINGTDKIIDSAKGLSSVSEKIKFVYQAVKRRFTGEKDLSREINDLDDAWKEGSGTSGEINLILLNLLGRLKITAYPLLVSTREHGKIDKHFPSFGQLNSVVAVAMIDDSHFYILDATLANQSIDCPPANILNREALLLRRGNIDWFTIEDQRPLFKQTSNIMCEVNKEDKLEGVASLQHYYFAKQYVLDTAIENKKLDDPFLNTKTPGLKIISSEKTLTESDDDPLFETIEFNYEPEQTNEFYSFKPAFLLQVPGNPFTAEKRNADIDFGFNQEIISSLKIMLPPSFEKEHLPASIKLITPDSSLIFSRLVAYSQGQIDITTNLQVRKSFFPKEEYESIRDFYKRLQGLAAEEIILKKKK
jgi:hypothetical protein